MQGYILPLAASSFGLRLRVESLLVSRILSLPETCGLDRQHRQAALALSNKEAFCCSQILGVCRGGLVC